VKKLKTQESATNAFFQHLDDASIDITIQLARQPKPHKTLQTMSKKRSASPIRPSRKAQCEATKEAVKLAAAACAQQK
jgi:hypothetical protein